MSASGAPLAGLRVAVTGAGGFVGRRLCPRLEAAGADVLALVRRAGQASAGQTCVVGDLAADDALRMAFGGCAAVVHLAAVTHGGARRADTSAFERVNVEGSRAVGEAARRAGVGRLVFMSSIKVNGEASGPGTAHPQPYTPDDAPAPLDAYGRSKLAAEQALVALAADLSITVLRPPLIYGPGQSGNLARLMRAVARGWPLPFGAIANRRSLVHVDNLADAAIAALAADIGPPVCYTLADTSVSTPGLVQAMADALGVRARLWAVPPELLRAAGALLGRRDLLARLTGSLVVDASAARATLGWAPTRTLSDGLSLAARDALGEGQ